MYVCSCFFPENVSFFVGRRGFVGGRRRGADGMCSPHIYIFVQRVLFAAVFLFIGRRRRIWL